MTQRDQGTDQDTADEGALNELLHGSVSGKEQAKSLNLAGVILIQSHMRRHLTAKGWMTGTNTDGSPHSECAPPQVHDRGKLELGSRVPSECGSSQVHDRGKLRGGSVSTACLPARLGVAATSSSDLDWDPEDSTEWPLHSYMNVGRTSGRIFVGIATLMTCVFSIIVHLRVGPAATSSSDLDWEPGDPSERPLHSNNINAGQTSDRKEGSNHPTDVIQRIEKVSLIKHLLDYRTSKFRVKLRRGGQHGAKHEGLSTQVAFGSKSRLKPTIRIPPFFPYMGVEVRR